MSGLVWERGPFTKCKNCAQEKFGLLSVSRDHYTMRCSNCRYSEDERLPKTNKKVIYLDQFAFSLLFNVESGGNLPKGHEGFSVEMHRRLRRLVNLQQALLPHSDIHHEETIVYRKAIELRHAYEFIGGDSRFVDSRQIELNQTFAAAKAFVQNTELALDTSADEVIEGERNGWLPLMHISVRSDYSVFADELRRERDSLSADFFRLSEIWRTNRPTFAQVLENEQASTATSKLSALRKSEAARRSDNPSQVLQGWNAPIQTEVRGLLHLFRDNGVPEDQCGRLVTQFWQSLHNRRLPHNIISSYLFAGIARRIISGQSKDMLKGMMNDVRAISAYAPDVDAMFVDRTCAKLLSESPLVEDLQYKARIFSLSEPQGFLSYLDEIEQSTSEGVRLAAHRLYGVE